MTPAQKLERLNDNITNMKRKGYLNETSSRFFEQDAKSLWKMLHNVEAQSMKEWSCTTCGITVYGPQKLLIEHHKTHVKRELRENEIKQMDYKLY